MSTALAQVSNGSEPEFSDQQIELIRWSLGMDKATPLEFDLFINLCKAKRLDPLTKQMYAVQYKGKWQYFASIDGLRVIAERTQKYLGQTMPAWCGPDLIWRDAWLEAFAPSAAKVGVYKLGNPHPTWGVATFKSYGTGKGNNWLSMPDVMLAKCAESIALRKAFPDDLSGLYVREEFTEPKPNPSDDLTPDEQAWPEDRRTAGWEHKAAVGLTPEPIDDDIIDAETGELAERAMAQAPGITREQMVRITALKSGLNWHIAQMREFSKAAVGKSNAQELSESEANVLIAMLEDEQDRLLDPDIARESGQEALSM